MYAVLCVLADYVNGGEMFTHLYQREHFTESDVRIYIAEIVLALETLHKVGDTQLWRDKVGLLTHTHQHKPLRKIKVD